ncbi:MAG: DUF362 domain-containing protein [Phycisphaerae bacterium]|nr:DUF362 domain-containing protein [Phycisphaerae bacterium]
MKTNETAFCRGHECSRRRARHRWVRWVFPATGLLALLWFLIRVIPKPSRAAYPCQRAAMPLASGFVVWVVGLVTGAVVSQRFRRLVRESRVVLAGLCVVTAVVVGAASLADWPARLAVMGEPWGPHGPLGEGKGIHPGRVVWVYDPNATDWDGYNSPERWWQDGHTDPVVVEKMVSQAIRGVAGTDSDAAAWDAIFRYFNDGRGKGDVGYQAGEKIAIKINLTTCNAAGGDVNPTTYIKKSSVMNRIDNSPQMILALLRQLADTVGADQNDITIGDPTGMVPNYYWDMIYPEFPSVRYLDNYGGSGRTRTEFSDVRMYWSTADAGGKAPDYLPTAFAEAAYLINFAILKGHSSGVTLCAKNHYGSILRTPDGYLRPELPGLPGQGTYPGYYNLHYSLPNVGWSPGTGHYRALVDLMGHSELGGKTVLYLIDGLFGGYYWEAHPYKWNMPPFNGDWPSSLFASQDPVAIDSVGYDFVEAEWPDVVRYGHSPSSKYDMQGGAEDYLHEAALANDPCSGTFYDPDHSRRTVRLASLGVHEHWNDPVNKQYSRNLGTGEGIELILLHSDPIEGDIDSDGDVDEDDLEDPANLGGDWGTVSTQP